MANANAMVPAGGQYQTPYLNANLQNFERRIEAGDSQGNLTGSETTELDQELQQYEQAVDGAQGSGNRQQAWQDASELNRSIFDLRHNDLGTMGPGGPNAHAPQLINPQNHPGVANNPEYRNPPENGCQSGQPYPPQNNCAMQPPPPPQNGCPSPQPWPRPPIFNGPEPPQGRPPILNG